MRMLVDSVEVRRRTDAPGTRSRLINRRLAHNGADHGARTRDPTLGKVVLYQLSHVRLRRSSIRKPRALRNPPMQVCFASLIT